MRVIVTGGAGFIGTNLIKKLLKEGHEAISIDDYSIGSRENQITGAEYYTMNVSDISDYSWLKPDIIFHLAGLSRIQPSFDNPTETFEVNTASCLKIAEWASKNNVKVIYAGSSSRWHDPYQSPYACFKHMGEEIFKLYKKVYGLKVEIARFYNVYGPYEIIDGQWAAVIGKWRGCIQSGKPIEIVGDGEQRRDFTHVDDIVDALYELSINNYVHEDAWELGSGQNYSVNEVADMFVRYGHNVTKKYIPDQQGNYRETKRESDDALEVMGWAPSDKLNQYIKELYE